MLKKPYILFGISAICAHIAGLLSNSPFTLTASAIIAAITGYTYRQHQDTKNKN